MKLLLYLLSLKIPFIVKNNSDQVLAQTKDLTNRFESRAFDTEGIFFGEGNFKEINRNSNQFHHPSNITKSWFERFITPSIRQNEQLRLNTTSNRKSVYGPNQNKTNENVTAIAGESLVTLDSKESFARRILVEEDGTIKLFRRSYYKKL